MFFYLFFNHKLKIFRSITSANSSLPFLFINHPPGASSCLLSIYLSQIHLAPFLALPCKLPFPSPFKTDITVSATQNPLITYFLSHFHYSGWKFHAENCSWREILSGEEQIGSTAKLTNFNDRLINLLGLAYVSQKIAEV